jgi:hypothetical protein
LFYAKTDRKTVIFFWKTSKIGSIKQIFQAETDRRRPEVWTLRASRAGLRPRESPTPRRRKRSARVASRSSSASSGEQKSEPNIAKTNGLKKCFCQNGSIKQIFSPAETKAMGFYGIGYDMIFSTITN